MLRKRTLLTLLFIALGLVIIGIAGLGTGNANHVNALTGLGAVIAVSGGVLYLVVWISTMVKQGRQKQAAWLLGTLLLSFVGYGLGGIACILVYLLVVPEMPRLANLPKTSSSLPAPILVGPASQAVFPYGQPVTLLWNTTGTRSYVTIQHPSDEPSSSGWQTTTSYTFTPKTTGVYSWMVVTAHGNEMSRYSESWWFAVQTVAAGW